MDAAGIEVPDDLRALPDDEPPEPGEEAEETPGLNRGDVLRPLALPEAAVPAADLLG